MSEEQSDKKGVQKYILYRRDTDSENEVIKAGAKAPSEIGIVDFHKFIKEIDLQPMELAQFLKIPCVDIDLLVHHGGWVTVAAQENLKQLLKCKSIHDVCRFLMKQDGKAGQRNDRVKEPKEAAEFALDEE